MYSNKTLTPEQQEKRDARRANFKALLEHLKEMNDADRIQFSSSSIINPDGHVLSPVNTILINLQRPGCTVVGGFHQWRKYNRHVVKGERGISIWYPKNAPKNDDEEIPDKILFSSITVFDVTQTSEFREEEVPKEYNSPIAPPPARKQPLVRVSILEPIKEYRP